MEKDNTPIEDLSDDLKEYLSTRYNLIVLKTAYKVSAIGAIASMSVILGICIVLFILFASISAGFCLSDAFGSYSLGFLVLAGIYLVLFVLVYLIRKKAIISPIRNRLIKEIFDDK